jgi:DNA-directed RNA polymerase specialized sigma24 family protein
LNNDTIADGYRFIRNFFKSYGHKAQQPDVEDVFQRAALRSLETGGSPDNFYAYLKYSCLQFFRDDLPKNSHQSVWESDAMHRGQNDSNLSSILEDMELIRPMLDDLPPSQREAVLMEYWGMSPDMAAAETGKTLQAVYIGRCRGVKTLSEWLTKST